MLALQGDFAPEASDGPAATYELVFGDDRVTVRIGDGDIGISREEPTAPDAVIATDTRTFAAVLTRRRAVEEAVRAGDLTVSGDVTAAIAPLLPRPETVETPSA